MLRNAKQGPRNYRMTAEIKPQGAEKKEQGTQRQGSYILHILSYKIQL